MSGRGAPTARRKRAVESFQNAAECIGTLEKGAGLFAITRGQFSMIDAILACLAQTGPAKISLWTWTIAEYEIECVNRLRDDGHISSGLLVIDHGALQKNRPVLEEWQRVNGPDSVRYVVNHAKIATIENDSWQLLLRGSMNLNFNPRFEQFDITEGGADFDLVRKVESELPLLSNRPTGKEVYSASRVSEAFEKDKMTAFEKCKVWNK